MLMVGEGGGLLGKGELMAEFGKGRARLRLGCFVGRLLGSGCVLVIDCVCVCCFSMMISNKILIIKPFCPKRQRHVVCFFQQTSYFFKHLLYFSSLEHLFLKSCPTKVFSILELDHRNQHFVHTVYQVINADYTYSNNHIFYDANQILILI